LNSRPPGESRPNEINTMMKKVISKNQHFNDERKMGEELEQDDSIKSDSDMREYEVLQSHGDQSPLILNAKVPTHQNF
jgi:hypothetical protein